MKGLNGKMIVLGQCKGNLYEMNSTNVHEMDAIHSKQSLKKDGAFELQHCWLGHLSVNAMNLGKTCCPTFSSICEPFIKGEQIKAMFPNDR